MPDPRLGLGGFKGPESDAALDFERKLFGDAAHFQGGPRRELLAMVRAAAGMRDEGKIPGAASLALSQLLLNLAGAAGKERALTLIGAFFDAADVPR
jgi:hypothetical protein